MFAIAMINENPDLCISTVSRFVSLLICAYEQRILSERTVLFIYLVEKALIRSTHLTSAEFPVLLLKQF